MSTPPAPASVEGVLARAVGLNPASIGTGSIERAVARRMAEIGSDDREAYARRVAISAEELQRLFDELMITESWFFRDSTPFDLLHRLVAAGWLGDPGRPPLRALSIPCASGEEPYSIALRLLESGLPADRFRIEAVDFSLKALERAKRGIYRTSALREVPAAMRSRWFEASGERCSVVPALRTAVRFHQGNLLDAARDSSWNSGSYDVIFCRNLLIYFHESARKQALATLGRLLKPGGLLFVGHSEMSASQHPGLAPHPDRSAFAFRRLEAAIEGEGSSSFAIPAMLAAFHQPAGIAGPGCEGPAPAEPARKPEVPEAARGLLDQAEALANGREYRRAIALCEQAIRAGAATPAAHRLLATLHQAIGTWPDAEQAYLKAIYLDPHDDDSLLALAMLARRRGDLVTAERYRKRALKSWQRKADP
jgi:chemotaxis protein methyltransferase WspC